MPHSKPKAHPSRNAEGLVEKYLRDSRDFATGFLFILPLLIGYEVGVLLLRSEVINWAHGLIRTVFLVFGRAEPLVFAALIAGLAWLALRHARRRRLDAELFGLMFIESLACAVALGLLCRLAAGILLPGGNLGAGRNVARDIVLSVGAGVYEEVVFRVVLMGAIYYGLKVWSHLRPGWAAAISILVSSLAFALCHHVGPYGDRWVAGLLAYRFILGVLFAALYIYRGLGIVVYTHALFDIFVSLSRA